MDISSLIEQAVLSRAKFLKEARLAFLSLYPELPNLVKRGKVQKQVLTKLNLPHEGRSKALVTEALEQFGYRHVKNEGVHYLRRGYDVVTNRHRVGYQYRGNE